MLIIQFPQYRFKTSCTSIRRVFLFLILLLRFATGAPAQEWLWAKRAGGTKDDYPTAMVTNESGNVYVAGYFYSQHITFGAFTLTNPGYTGAPTDGSAIFLVKYDGAGNVLWAKGAGGNGMGRNFPSDMVIDAAGNIYMTGQIGDTAITFGTLPLTNYGNSAMFLVKYDSSGNALWVKGASGVGCGAQANSVATDATGHVYVTGYFCGSAIGFGSDTLTNASTSPFSYDVFLTKYDTTGNIIWARGAGGNNNDEANSVATDREGNIYVTGSFTTSITFDTTLNGSMFLVKYDSSGSILWAKSAFLGFSSQFVATDIWGNVYAAGSFTSATAVFGTHNLARSSGDLFIVKYNATGDILWARNGGGYSSLKSIAADSVGNLYLVGDFGNDTVAFGGTTLTNPLNNGAKTMFIARYDSSGTPLWAKGCDSSYNRGLVDAIDIAGNIYVAGDFSYGVALGITTLVSDSAGTTDVFIAKLSNADTGVPPPGSNSSCLNIYPNPNSGSFSIYVSSPRKEAIVIRITNVLGKKIEEFTAAANQLLQVQLAAPRGIYFVTATASDQISTLKVIIQ